MTSRAFLAPALRLALGGLFAFAGFSKLADPAAFAAAILAYRLVPWEIAVPLAYYLPWLEILCGLALASGWRRVARGAIPVAAGMLLVFAAALGSAIWRGLDIECGCFGGGGNGPVAELGLVAAMGAALFSVARCGGILGCERGRE
jgi:uncharacterized membrane protein YphA (DoxX/SURF4 family)